MTTDEKLNLIMEQQSEILELLRPKKKKRDERPSTRFEEWWGAYPKHINKKGCLEKWKARKLDEIADIIISDTRTRKIYDAKWKEGFIPHSTTYLNQSRWESEIETRTRSDKAKSRSERVSDAIFGPDGDFMDLGQAGGPLRQYVDKPDSRRALEQNNESGMVCEALVLQGRKYTGNNRKLDGDISTDSAGADTEIKASKSNAYDLFSVT